MPVPKVSLRAEPASERSPRASGTWGIRPEDAFASGRIVDHGYRIIDRIGGGAVTMVLRARDLRLGRDVALKVVRPAALALPDAAERFVVEARALARARDPSVVEVLALGEWACTPYLVMEYVPGIPLDEWLALRQIRPPTLDEALALVDRICLGVDAVHGSGLAFYDLTAASFLVAPGLRAVVADLGASHAYPALGDDGDRVARDSSTTAPEVLLGSVTVPRGRERADVYAVGALAYRLLVGRYPFDDEDADQVMAAQLWRPPPPPRAFRRDLPRTFEPVLLGALEKDPARRTASVHELRMSLHAARHAARRSP